LPISQTLSTLQYHQNRRTHQTPALTSNDQTSSTNPGRTNPQPQTRSQNGPVRDSASKARNLPPRAALHPPRQAQHLGLRSTIRQRRVRLRQRVDRHITHIQHQQQRGRLHGEDGRRQSRRSLLVEKRQAKEQSVVNRQQGLRFERVARHYVRFAYELKRATYVLPARVRRQIDWQMLGVCQGVLQNLSGYDGTLKTGEIRQSRRKPWAVETSLTPHCWLSCADLLQQTKRRDLATWLTPFPLLSFLSLLHLSCFPFIWHSDCVLNDFLRVSGLSFFLFP